MQYSGVKTYYNKGTAFYHLGKYSEAIKAYDKAVELDPKYFKAYIDKGVILLNNFKKYEKAIKVFDQAIAINNDENVDIYGYGSRHNFSNCLAYYNKGITLGELGKYEEAIKAYNQAIKINPKLAQAYNDKGLALKELGKHKEND